MPDTSTRSHGIRTGSATLRHWSRLRRGALYSGAPSTERLTDPTFELWILGAALPDLRFGARSTAASKSVLPNRRERRTCIVTAHERCTNQAPTAYRKQSNLPNFWAPPHWTGLRAPILRKATPTYNPLRGHSACKEGSKVAESRHRPGAGDDSDAHGD